VANRGVLGRAATSFPGADYAPVRLGGGAAAGPGEYTHVLSLFSIALSPRGGGYAAVDRDRGAGDE